MEKLIIIGAGGHAKSIADCIDKNKYELVGFIDSFSNEKEWYGKKILAKSIEEISNFKEYTYFIAIGNNKIRKKWYDKLIQMNLDIATIIDGTAMISPTAKIGRGCFIGKMAVINSDSVIGDDTIINTKALVEHECKVGSHCHISTNSVINGNVKVGNETFIGSSAVVIGQLNVGDNVIIGAGSTVIRDIPNNVTAVGVPTRIIKEGNS